MPVINIGKNLDQVEIKDMFAPVPVGPYRVQVQAEPEIKDSKPNEKTGEVSQYLNWKLSIIDNEEFKGRILWHITSLKETALGTPTGLKATLSGLGVPWDAAGNINTTETVGQTMDVIVGQKVHKDALGNPTDKMDNVIEAIVGVEVAS